MKHIYLKNFSTIILCFLCFWLLFCLSPALAQETLLHEEWSGVYFQGKKFGFGHGQGWEIKDKGKTGYRLEGESLIKLKIADQVQETFLKETTWLDEQLVIQKIYFRQHLNEAVMEIRGQRTTQGFSLIITSGGEERKEEIKASAQVLTSNSAGFVLFKRGLEPGKTYRLEIFLEPLLLVVPLEITVKGIEKVNFEGKEVEAYRLEQKYADLSATAWVAVKTGEMIKEVSPQGLTSRRESKTEALAFDPAKIMGLEELFVWSLIPVKTPLKNPSALKALTVRMGKLSQKDFMLEDERQHWSQVKSNNGEWQGVLDIRLSPLTEKESLLLREAAKGHEEYLKPEPWAQSDHPEIKALARKIVGEENNAYRAAQKINLWVNKNIAKKYQDSFSALDTLKSREGECQAHSWLFAALARSQGIPTRMAYGLVYMTSWGGFLYHQWPEVWVGRWIALDPTLGQVQADATHIKLTQGGQEAAVKVVSLVGKVEITLISQ